MATKKTKAENGKLPGKKTVSPRSGADVTKHQFKPGNPGGSGRPKTRKLREMLNENISDEQWENLLKKMYTKASGGDVQAFKAIAEYRDGKPSQAIDLTSNGETVPSLLVIERYGAKSKDQ